MELAKELFWADDNGLKTTQFAFGDNAASLKLAEDLLNEICQKYGGYNWRVGVKGGVVMAQEMSFPPQWWMVRRLQESDFSASNLKADVLRSAGEWLERANLQRKRLSQELVAPYRVEGVPEKEQPNLPPRIISGLS